MAPSTAIPSRPHSSRTANVATGFEWTGNCAKWRARISAKPSPFESLQRLRSRSPRHRTICSKPWMRARKPRLLGKPRQPLLAWTGFTGLSPRSRQRHEEAASRTLATCLPKETNVFAVLIRRAITAKASALPRRRSSRSGYVLRPISHSSGLPTTGPNDEELCWYWSKRRAGSGIPARTPSRPGCHIVSLP